MSLYLEWSKRVSGLSSGSVGIAGSLLGIAELTLSLIHI